MNQSIYEKIVYLRDYCRNPIEIVRTKKQIRRILKKEKKQIDFGTKSVEIDWKYWKNVILHFATANSENALIIADRLQNDRLFLKKYREMSEADEPIYICIVKNDLQRIQKSYEYHKQLGIKNFVFIDNNSDDGTYEWLLEQDVCVIWTEAQFCSSAKSAWLLMIMLLFGFDRWYLILDSDELLTYPGCESHGIDELVHYLEENHAYRLLSFMLDMYANKKLSEIDQITEWDYNDYCYFDRDSYKKMNNLHFQKIIGGPRKRVFNNVDDNSMVMIQNKYPLVYMKMGELYRYHYVYPYYHNFDTECISVLRHYKFLPGDLKKYEVIAQNGNYANGSQLYKESLNKIAEDKDMTFWYVDSIKYNSSNDLLMLDFVKEIEWTK